MEWYGNGTSCNVNTIAIVIFRLSLHLYTHNHLVQFRPPVLECVSFLISESFFRIVEEVHLVACMTELPCHAVHLLL